MLAALCHHKVTVQAQTPHDRITPMGNAEHRQQPSPYGGHRGRCLYHKTVGRLSVFRDALPRKDFYDRSATHCLFAATCRRLCRFARSSLHWHRLRLIGAVSSILYAFFSIIQYGVSQFMIELWISVNDGKSSFILRV